MDLFEYAAQNIVAEVADAAPEEPIFTVSNLTGQIRSVLEGQFGGSRIWVKGEISNFRGRNQTGHMYFSLKDEDALLGCAFFRGSNRNLTFEPKEGLQVLAGGRISVYPPRGTYQLIVERILPAGTGELYLRFEQLKKKLEAEGLFAAERKRPIPPFPTTIGLVTSATGAVVRDIIHVIRRRCPYVTILLSPVRVQGEGAKEDIASAIEQLNDPALGVHLLIVGRGGGSIEDLWAFNEELVARAIVASKIPIISAVGHQTDFTIADFVADVRAATPSQAAELSVPDVEEVRRKAATLIQNAVRELALVLKSSRGQLEGLVRASPLRDPGWLVRSRLQRVEWATERMARKLGIQRDRQVHRMGMARHRLTGLLSQFLSARQSELKRLAGNLSLLDPLAILARGYSVVHRQDGAIIKSVSQVVPEDDLWIRLHRGKLLCRVKKTFGK